MIFNKWRLFDNGPPDTRDLPEAQEDSINDRLVSRVSKHFSTSIAKGLSGTERSPWAFKTFIRADHSRAVPSSSPPPTEARLLLPTAVLRQR